MRNRFPRIFFVSIPSVKRRSLMTLIFVYKQLFDAPIFVYLPVAKDKCISVNTLNLERTKTQFIVMFPDVKTVTLSRCFRTFLFESHITIKRSWRAKSLRSRTIFYTMQIVIVILRFFDIFRKSKIGLQLGFNTRF